MKIGNGLVLGGMLGVAFGIWNLIATWLDPLADDTPRALLISYGPMFLAWGAAGFAAARRTGRTIEGLKAGATVAFATFVVFALANLVRVNLFLDAVRDRADWRYMMLRFQTSGFESLRAFVTYEFVKGAPLKVFVASAIGASVGVVGGLVAMPGRRELRRSPIVNRQ